MHKLIILATVLLSALSAATALAQTQQTATVSTVGYGQSGAGRQQLPVTRQQPATQGYDVFVPIGKYLSQGNTEALSAWFAENLEISVLSKGGDASRAQAKQILKGFFDSHTPRSFTITHTAGRGNMKYALGELKAGGETFNVTVFVNCKDGKNQIQQFNVERF